MEECGLRVRREPAVLIVVSLVPREHMDCEAKAGM